MKVIWSAMMVLFSSNLMAKESDKLHIVEPIPLRSYLLQAHPTLELAEAFSESEGQVFILYQNAKSANRKIEVKDALVLELSNSILTYSSFPVGFISKSPSSGKSLDSICSMEFKDACKLEVSKTGKISISINKTQYTEYTETVPTMSYSQKRIGKIDLNRSLPQCNPPHCCGEPDGCDFVRDSWGGVSFKETCNSHDRCYYTVGTSPDACNETFKRDLLDDCKQGTLICVGSVCVRDPIREAACVTWATAQVLAVIVTQGEIHSAAQSKQKKYESENSCSSVPKDICPDAAVDGGFCPSGVKGSQCRVTKCPGGVEVDYLYTCDGTSWKLGPGGGSTGKSCR